MKTGVQHAENFPVASWLCPAHLRPVIANIYWFARTADDLADEGNAPAEQRLQALSQYRQQLDEAVRWATSSNRDDPTKTPPDTAFASEPQWRWIFAPLVTHMARHQLPPEPLHHLLDAFVQDVHRTAHQHHYPNSAELLDYCSRSANPIGRLLLHLYGVNDAQSLTQSDAICSALQLINFWQDLSVDLPRQRHYLPQDGLDAHGIERAWLSLPIHTWPPGMEAALEQLMRQLVQEARDLMQQGQALPKSLPGRVGWELRLVVQGGLLMTERIQQLHHRTWATRPKLSRWDLFKLLQRAITA